MHLDELTCGKGETMVENSPYAILFFQNLKENPRGVAQPGSAPALGAGSRRFKSSRPDQIISIGYIVFHFFISILVVDLYSGFARKLPFYRPHRFPC